MLSVCAAVFTVDLMGPELAVAVVAENPETPGLLSLAVGLVGGF